MLSLRPMSGYDIKKTIASSLSNFWNESYGQIYPILRSLVAEGLVTPSEATSVAGQPPDPLPGPASIAVARQTRQARRVYALTEAGQADLRRWLAKPVAYEVGRSEILLKLFFGSQTSAQQNMRQVAQFRAEQVRLLHEYAAIEEWLEATYADKPGLPYWLMTVSYGQRVSRALTDWSDDTLSRLQALQLQPEGDTTTGSVA